ncbi:fimbria/pilus outer membrane usher protein [Escherichia coli]
MKLAAALPLCSFAAESNIYFNPEFLFLSEGNNTHNINLDYFSHNTGSLPGKYNVDIYLNDVLVEKDKEVYFESKNNKLKAKINASMLDRWGVDSKKIKKKEIGTGDILTFINEASENFNLNNRQLKLIVPQSYLKPRDWLSTPEHLWDAGIPALMLNYRFNEYRTNGSNYISHSKFLSLESTLNLGRWRLYNSGNWSSNTSGENSHWQPMMLYLQRDYSAFQGGLFTVGQTAIDNGIFDSFPFEGVQIASDDSMIASDLYQYSPIVRGIAYSQSEVIIRQNGLVIYQKSVAPGSFEIRDFNPIYNGDLSVEIRESNGSVRYYKQTMASLPVLQREGRFRYNFAIGKYWHTDYDTGPQNEPRFFLASGAIGLPSEYTLYGGNIYAEDYSSILLGLGKYSNVWGAFSFDITHASSDFSSNSYFNYLGKKTGQSYRAMFSRGFGESSTTLNITGYRHSTKDYYSFNELQHIKSSSFYDEKFKKHHERARIQAQIYQDFEGLGTLNLSGSKEQYWDKLNGYNLTASISIPFRYFSSFISVGLNKSPYYNNIDKSIYFSLVMPIEIFQNSHKNYLSTSIISNNSDTQQQLAINGGSDDNEFRYTLAQGWQNKGRGETANLNLNYLSSYFQLNSSYAYHTDAKQWSYGIAGGVALHQDGITLSQPLSFNSASALVRAKGTQNVKILNRSGVYTDWRGYAVVPNLITYNKNQISLDVNTLNDDVELLNTDVNVIPNRGALVAADFSVNSGNKAMITLLQKNGSPVPFGSLVSLANVKETNTNIVSDSGQVYMSGLPDEGKLHVKWGETEKEECKINYQLPKKNRKYYEVTLKCM